MTPEEAAVDAMLKHAENMRSISNKAIEQYKDNSAKAMACLDDPWKWYRDRGILPPVEVKDEQNG